MAYLNLDLNFFDHPKIVRLVGLLGNGSQVLPIKLWCYCGKYHFKDGVFNDYSIDEIESLAGWCGEKGKMVEAMLKVGLMVKYKNGYKINDWEDHQGHIWALKVRNKKVAQNRWNSIRNAESNDDTSGIPKHTNGIPLPIHSIPSIPTNKNNNEHLANEFEKLWENYPRQLGKKAAKRHYLKSVKSSSDLQRIQTALDNYRSHIVANKTPEKFILHGSTWFNNWEDYEQAKSVKISFQPVPHGNTLQDQQAKKVESLVALKSI